MKKSHKGEHLGCLYTFTKIPHKIRISLELRRSVFSSDRIRRALTVARSYGLDPRQVYEECVKENGGYAKTNQGFPQYVDVDPSWASSPSALE